jgi:hypothetical protein
VQKDKEQKESVRILHRKRRISHFHFKLEEVVLTLHKEVEHPTVTFRAVKIKTQHSGL